MAKFLNTQAISSELMSLIKEAKEKIVLVSYSFKVNPQIQERLKTVSKIGTLSEIVIVYGRTELKQSELDWIKEIQDLKLIEKSDLHAKCYLNEHRAIICSMNLYDYSQQNNIEMGILITREHDKEAYEELVDEINHIKVNGVRKNISLLVDNIEMPEIKKETKFEWTAKSNNEKLSNNAIKESELNNEQKLKFLLLKNWRKDKSKSEKTSAFLIFTDEELKKIVAHENIDIKYLYEVLPKKKVIKYGEDIIRVLSGSKYFTIGKITNTWYQNDGSSYDRVKLKILDSGQEKWFDTANELPNKEKVVAVKLNNTWFNEYFYLEEEKRKR